MLWSRFAFDTAVHEQSFILGLEEAELQAARPRVEDEDIHNLTITSGRRYDTGHGAACQMSAAYSAIVRSLENLPDAAMFRIALRAQS